MIDVIYNEIIQKKIQFGDVFKKGNNYYLFLRLLEDKDNLIVIFYEFPYKITQSKYDCMDKTCCAIVQVNLQGLFSSNQLHKVGHIELKGKDKIINRVAQKKIDYVKLLKELRVGSIVKVGTVKHSWCWVILSMNPIYVFETPREVGKDYLKEIETCVNNMDERIWQMGFENLQNMNGELEGNLDEKKLNKVVLKLKLLGYLSDS